MSDQPNFPGLDDDTTSRLTQIQARYTDMLMSKHNVIGVGIGYRKQHGEFIQQPCLVVMVTEKIPSEELPPEDRIPTELEGIPVDVQELGRFSAM
jgi:hypothetical protein